jgi:hypothetical protein
MNVQEDSKARPVGYGGGDVFYATLKTGRSNARNFSRAGLVIAIIEATRCLDGLRLYLPLHALLCHPSTVVLYTRCAEG